MILIHFNRIIKRPILKYYLKIRDNMKPFVGMWNQEPQQICSPEVVSPSHGQV